MRWLQYALLLFCVACASSKKAGKDADPSEVEEYESYLPDEQDSSGNQRGDVAPTVSYAATDEGNWARGEEAYADEDYLAAQRFYMYIRNKFPYSKYSAKSQLRLADCYYERGRYVEAIDAYQNFTRMYPTHPDHAYALFRVGRAHYEQLPGNFFPLPPAHEKDQVDVQKAEVALRDFVERFPEHKDAVEGRKLLAEVRAQLIAHERYAADFYRREGRTRAYVGRLEVIRSRYPEAGVTAGLLLEMIRAYVELDELDKAKEVHQVLLEKFPRSKAVQKANPLVSKPTS